MDSNIDIVDTFHHSVACTRLGCHTIIYRWPRPRETNYYRFVVFEMREHFIPTSADKVDDLIDFNWLETGLWNVYLSESCVSISILSHLHNSIQNHRNILFDQRQRAALVRRSVDKRTRNQTGSICCNLRNDTKEFRAINWYGIFDALRLATLHEAHGGGNDRPRWRWRTRKSGNISCSIAYACFWLCRCAAWAGLNGFAIAADGTLQISLFCHTRISFGKCHLISKSMFRQTIDAWLLPRWARYYMFALSSSLPAMPHLPCKQSAEQSFDGMKLWRRSCEICNFF